MNESVAPKCPRCGAPMPSGFTGGVCPRCAAALLQAAQTEMPGSAAKPPFTPPSVAELAPLFPQLEILELLGRGGMGAVYKARQKELDRIVALKILPPGIGGDPAFAERFAREARALAKLNHPGIVTVHDFGHVTDADASAAPLYYFLMEFVDGVTLRKLLEGGRVSPREALAIVPQICDALQYAHDQGIVHRDIKPENILLDQRGRVKVADFGLARLMGGDKEPAAKPTGEAVSVSLTGAGNVLGTPAYMAPEQAEHPAEVDHRADIYALGVVFYQMLTGELPGKRLEPPSRKVQIDVRLDEVVLHALEREPERRYQQASEVKSAVETIAGSPAAPGRQDAPQPGPTASVSLLTRLRQPSWLKFFLGGFLAMLIVWCLPLLSSAGGAMGFAAKGVVLGLWGGAIALMTALLVRKGWVAMSLAGLGFAVLLWLGTAMCMTDAWPVGVVALALALVLFLIAAVKLQWPRGFLTGFAQVFLLVFGIGVYITAIMPQSYLSTARLTITPKAAETAGTSKTPGIPGFYDPYLIQTEFQIMQSGVILDKVIQDLDLSREWSKKYGRGQPLSAADVLRLLRTRLDLRPVRNTSLIEIRVYSDIPAEAARIANAIAETYLHYVSGTDSFSIVRPVQAEMVDRAAPSVRPVRPNQPLNLALAAAAGLVLGIVAGAARARRKTPPTAG